MRKKISLCNFCDFDITKCTWMQDFTPVEGWKAQPTVIVSNSVENQQSYHVIKCPLFKPFGNCADKTPKKTIFRKSKKIRCIETGKIYTSSKEAARDVGLASISGITGCARGKFKTAAGFQWQYVQDGDNE